MQIIDEKVIAALKAWANRSAMQKSCKQAQRKNVVVGVNFSLG